MRKIAINGLHLWQFENFRVESIRHFVTDRNSYEQGKEFTIGNSSSHKAETIKNNRDQLARAMEIKSSQLYFPTQIHKTKIVQVTHQTSNDDLNETDALITIERDLCIAVMSADCVTILLYDKRNKAIGAVHSGWRGTVARILEKTLESMRSSFGTRGEDIIAGIGPSVCQESYEVGEEVVSAVHTAFGKEFGLLIPQANNKAMFDLWKANKTQLLEFGVKEPSIEISDLCTVKNNHHFFSARKGDTGRFGAGLVLT